MQIHVIKSQISDNYFYLVAQGSQALLIDPVDAPTAIEAVRANELELVWVVNTHFHHDHIAGDDEVLSAFPDARLAVARGDAEIVESNVDADIDLLLSGGDELPLGDGTLHVLDTPGHTPGHASLLTDGHLFSGDTIFIGGAGNCSFGGDPGVLFRTFRDVLSQLDGDTLVYPGHDYSVRNLEFCLDIEPDNAEAAKLLDEARASDGLFNTTLETERRYNPFFRTADTAFQDHLESERSEVWSEQASQSDSRAETAFRTVRALRNNW